jgi:hypothetical protein
MLPPKKDCVMLADVLGTIRDRVARAKLADERRREKSRPDTSRDLSQAMYQDINRGR